MQPLKPPKPSVPPPPSLPPPASSRQAVAQRPPSAPIPQPKSSVPPPNFRAPAPVSIPPQAPAPSFAPPPAQPAPSRPPPQPVAPQPVAAQPIPVQAVGPHAAPIQATEIQATEVQATEVQAVDDNELLSDDEITALAEELEESESRVRHHALRNRGTLAIWIVAASIGLVVVLQRTGLLLAVASVVGQEEQYLTQEKELLGGPGSHTVREAELLWETEIGDTPFPFSEGKTADSPKPRAPSP